MRGLSGGGAAGAGGTAAATSLSVNLRLRDLVRGDVLAATLAAALTACSAPAADAVAREPGAPGMTSSVTGPASVLAVSSGGEAEGSGGRKARLASTRKEPFAQPASGACPEGMASVGGRFCIDRYEAALLDVLPGGEERPHSPFTPVGPRDAVRAVSAPNVYPQGYISAVEAQRACGASGKRLCQVAEWGAACRGPEARAWGYGEQREPGRCNDRGRNPVLALSGARARHWDWKTMNQPALNQLESTLARTGEHEGCTNEYGVYDMVGNLHEWVADPSGTFYGGYYQDVASVGHGAGCGYLTTAHEARYHDYSTGFRCCADLPGTAPPPAPVAAPRRGKARR
ncbi:MAG: hypothetical protein JWP97_6768 [Labilithrix sp.]|nr:hypothetical protein [Labilithrix sp.]